MFFIRKNQIRFLADTIFFQFRSIGFVLSCTLFRYYILLLKTKLYSRQKLCWLTNQMLSL